MKFEGGAEVEVEVQQAVAVKILQCSLLLPKG